jgi:hypothetical protein
MMMVCEIMVTHCSHRVLHMLVACSSSYLHEKCIFRGLPKNLYFVFFSVLDALVALLNVIGSHVFRVLSFTDFLNSV